MLKKTIAFALSLAILAGLFYSTAGRLTAKNPCFCAKSVVKYINSSKFDHFNELIK